MSDCLFCRIVAGSIPAKVVYQDAQCLAFEDINPQAPVHLLVIPRQHLPTVDALGPQDAGTVGALFLAARHLARERGIAESGYRLVMNTNADAGQTVFHIHLHLLGGRHLGWPPG